MLRCRRPLPSALSVVLALVGLTAPAGLAQSPTPTTTVENGAGTVRLQTFYDGGLLAPGTHLDDGTENDSIPATGAGTRLMWYPAKAALRAGRVGRDKDGTQWDAGRVGEYSAAFGVDTKASGLAAAAMGSETIASGDYATALGIETTASGDVAVAMGFSTRAIKGGAVAMGQFSDATGRATTAMGLGASATAEAATAMGDFSNASGKAATAMGKNTFAKKEGATAVGKGAIASGEASTAMGKGTVASSRASTAMGNSVTASGKASTAMGYVTTASARQSVAMGFQTRAADAQSVTIGRYNDANRSDDGTFTTGPLLVAGNGTGTTSRSDALVLRSNGNLTISGTLTENSDRRLKTGIDPFDDKVLGKLADLRPVRYQFKDQHTHPSGEQVGLVAQDVQKEFPALVSTGADGMLSLSYSKFTAVLLKGLQEQQSNIDSLRQRTQRLDEMQRDIAALRAEVRGTRAAGWAGGLPLRSVALLLIGGLLGAGLLHLRRR